MNKKLSLSAITFILFFSMFSQENSKIDKEINLNQNVNELKLNAVIAILGSFEVSYERTLTDDSSIGVSFLIPYDNELDSDLNYYLSPYYRIFFGENTLLDFL
jgi:hypothetical protein